MMSLISHSLRRTVPALLALTVVLIAVLSALVTWRSETALWENFLAKQASSLGFIALPAIEQALAHESAMTARNHVMDLAVVPAVDAAFLTDENHVIRYSTQAPWEGRTVGDVRPRQSVVLMERARTSQVAQIEKSHEGGLLRAAFPVSMAPLPGELRPTRTAVLMVEFDLETHHRELRQRLVQRTLVIGVVTGLLAVGLWLFIHIRFARRIHELVTAAQATGRGEIPQPVAESGQDELSLVARAFNRMAQDLHQTLTSLQQSEARTRSIGDNLPECMVYQLALEPDGTRRFLHVSAGVQRLHGESVQAVLEDASLIYRQVIEEDQARIAELETQSASTLGVFKMITRIRRADGTLRWVSIASQPRRMDQGRTLWDGVEIDITDRVNNEEELKRTNRALRILSRSNQSLVHSTEESGLLVAICRILIEETGHAMAWIGFASNDPGRPLRTAAWAGPDFPGTQAPATAWPAVGYPDDPTLAAFRLGRPERRDEALIELPPELQPAGHPARPARSAAAFPLRVDGKAIGVLSVYSERRCAFDDREMKVFEEIADDLAFGLHALRVRFERERLIRTIDSHYDGAYWMNSDNRLIYVNESGCRSVGYTREELLGQPLTFISPRLVNRGYGAIWASLRSTGSYTAESVHRRKDGSEFPVEVVATYVRFGDDEYYCGFARDITARKQAEESLATTSERLALALHASKFGVWRTNLQDRTTSWDARMFEIFGLPFSPTAPSIDAVLALIVDEDRPVVAEAWRPNPTTPANHHLRFCLSLPNNRIRHVELHGIIHKDSSGNPQWAIGVAGDITEIVQATAESERLKSQLLQAQKMEALGSLAAGVAHDFNNLLTGIQGFVELASSTLTPTHEATELLKQAQRGALSARDLVRRILDYSRSNKNQTRTATDLVQLVRDTAPLLAAVLPANITLAVTAAYDHANADVDSGQMQQVLMNLCTNAAHAIGNRAGSIRIEVDRCLLPAAPAASLPAGCSPGAHVRIAIHDTGCGMDEITRQRIFEPFFTTKRAGEGTGLGLPIVRDILHSHRGGIEVASSPGIGTTFTLYLPCSALDSTTDRLKVLPGKAAPANKVGNGQRILIVDDEPSVALVTRLTLQKHGFRPEMHTSPNDAWAHFASEGRHYQLLIVDQNMPEITGREFIEKVRNLHPAMPIIMMSGRIESGNTLAQIPGEPISTLKKPFELTELLDAVVAVLNQSHAASLKG